MKLSTILMSAFAAILPATISSAQGCGAATSFGTSCSSLRLSCNGAWMTGQSVRTNVALHRPGTSVSFMLGTGAASPVDLTAVGAPGCFLYTNPVTSIASVLVGDGFVNQTWNIPADPSLTGARFTLQVAAVMPNANSLGVTTTNALEITITDQPQ